MKNRDSTKQAVITFVAHHRRRGKWRKISKRKKKIQIEIQSKITSVQSNETLSKI